MNYLDFEEPIKLLDKQLAECIELGEKSDVDVSETCSQIQSKLKSTIGNLRKFNSPGKKFKFQDIQTDPTP